MKLVEKGLNIGFERSIGVCVLGDCDIVGCCFDIESYKVFCVDDDIFWVFGKLDCVFWVGMEVFVCICVFLCVCVFCDKFDFVCFWYKDFSFIV